MMLKAGLRHAGHDVRRSLADPVARHLIAFPSEMLLAAHTDCLWCFAVLGF